MGSVIQLELDGLILDYGKNEFWNDHAQLFQSSDYSVTRPEDDGDDHVELSPDEQGGMYERSLKQTIGRLDLLGYSVQACRAFLQDNIQHVFDHERVEEGDYEARVTLQPEWILAVAASVRLDLVLEAQRDYYARHFGASASFDEAAHKRHWLAKIRKQSGLESIPQAQFGDVLRHLHMSFGHESFSRGELCHPYVVLRLLGENPDNADRAVTWDHSDLVIGGWASADQFKPYLDPANQVLVVTEGSTDAAVVRKALEQLRPDIAEFFYFVDMAENYPFTGTGNLFRVAQGLTRIRIQNKVVILYDNDAEGSFNHQRTLELKRPPHVGVLTLPTLDEFCDYPTIGPDGPGRSDINGRAVSIELFLQTSDSGVQPPVRWGSFHEKGGVYQGVVEDKASLIKRFLDPRSHAGDFPRLPALIDALVVESTRLSAIARHDQERGPAESV